MSIEELWARGEPKQVKQTMEGQSKQICQECGSEMKLHSDRGWFCSGCGQWEGFNGKAVS